MTNNHPTAGVACAALLCAGISAAMASQEPAGDPTPGRQSYWSSNTIAADSAPRGKMLFNRFCTECHGPVPARPAPEKSTGAPSTMAGPMPPPGPPGTAELQVKYGGALPAELEKRTDLNFEWVRSVIRHGYHIMAPVRKTEMSDADVDSIAAYLTKDKQGNR